MKQKWIARIGIFFLLVCLVCRGCARNDFTYLDAKNGVARVYCILRTEDGSAISGSSGSGFFIGENGKDPEYLITNYHVVEDYIAAGAGEWVTVAVDEDTALTLKAYVEVYFDAETFTPANVVSYNETADVAVLRLNTPTDQRVALTLLEPTEEMVGTQVYGIGFPGLSDNSIMDAASSNGIQDMTVTSGTIGRLLTSSGSGVRRIQTDMVIQHGNSGGPMVNSQGQVLGINSWGVSDSDTQEQNYYACNIAEAILLLQQNNIPYTLASGAAAVNPLVMAAAGVVVILLIIVVFLLAKRKPSSRKPVSSSDIPAPTGEDSGYRLQGVSGALSGQRYMIRKSGSLMLGRNPELCNVIFPNVPGVSGKHCAVWYDHGKLYLQDLNSTHGTFLASGAKLLANQTVEVHAGDSFYLGSPQERFLIAEKRGN